VSLFQAIVLGIVQGVTEFAPVSSSGHLILVPWLFGWSILNNPSLNKTFDVALHFGTFVGVVVYFRPRIVTLLAGLGRLLARWKIEGDPERKLALMVIISTIPGGALGFKAGDVIEERLGSAALVAALTVAFGVVLWAADRWGRKVRALRQYSWGDSVAIGLAQAAALVPGVSRSGITMTTALGLGSEREAAAYYSFLISIPLIGGAVADKLLKLARSGLPPGMTAPFAAGTLAAAVSGYLCIRFLLRYLQRRSLAPFAWYRVVIGLALLGWALHRGA
jgi:undecaprenyl-diphosphatase